MDKFSEYMNDLSPDSLVSNRVKLLIKNMFANKEEGWKKTRDLN
jgi:hypothetical protein